ncbi:response regulator [Thalassotalea sp. M1531]|uniref:histidine kinase n=1 Tax=Thalassotalea algicola TaxID=2716224 RepID=A0A7Y0LC31_9GAMM|nr:PAS-domain containing protein [Thalassotalea algicola]NMP31809.1 response regulator [Thalassotalea algicola]
MLIWQSFDSWLISLISIAYFLVLFAVAYFGQKQSQDKWHNRPWIYGLSLGVSCTSWAFYGTVGQAAATGSWLAPIYIGTILCFVFAWPMLLRMLRISKQQNITSIADFIACRYDRSPQIAGLVTLVALIGTIPYIALQLRAVSTSFDLLTGTYQSGINTTVLVTIVLIAFSILFGTRQVAASRQNRGLVLAIAFSSIVKLFALTAIGIFATFFIFDGFNDLLLRSETISFESDSDLNASIYFAISQAILGMITIVVLPQQFHMAMIENHHEQELKTARWLYPLYLVLINLFVLPIAIAGLATFPGGSVDADTFVITLPLFFQQSWLVLLVYIGGLAAATSMVIIATIVLSTMLTTEIINPLLLKGKSRLLKDKPQVSGLILNLRRITIALLLILALGFERVVSQQNHLATIGLLSFVLLAQLAPLIWGALYWRKATTKGALIGLVVGSAVWCYLLLLPSLIPDAAWLYSSAIVEWTGLDNISVGLLASLLANVSCFVGVSLFSQRSVGEQLQAEIFIHKPERVDGNKLSNNDLYHLLQRFVSSQAAEELMNLLPSNSKSRAQASAKLVEHTRLQLAGVLGSASTRMVMNAATEKEMPLEDVVHIVDEASKIFQFNRELLQAGVENIEQGISVVDADMRIVAWNQRYIELLGYPEGFLTAGKPIEDVLRFNADRGVIQGEDKHALIAKRIDHMRKGTNHHFQRIMPNGVVLEIRGQAMPGGGFVSTFSDITAHVEAERALQQANEGLEKRVEERTVELVEAKAEAEAANRSKTRFLAAASHDLMQPFNALTLFTTMLQKRVNTEELTELAGNIQHSLTAVEGLLSDLVEISKLDSSAQKVECSTFAVADLLAPLNNEFSVLADGDDIDFHYQASSCFVETDKRMVRRIIQNFLSNAFRYAPHGKVLLGARRQKDVIRIEVWDSGVGIPTDKQDVIFKEFERLKSTEDKPGLGLGLAISDRIAKLLNLKLSVRSTLDRGSVFSVDIPRATSMQSVTKVSDKALDKMTNDFPLLPVLLIDNDELLLKALSSQLADWQCLVLSATDLEGVQTQLLQDSFIPQLIIADYHLDDGENGVDVVQLLEQQYQWDVPCIICSADPSEHIRQRTSDAKFSFMRKPIKSLALKRTIKQLLTAE